MGKTLPLGTKLSDAVPLPCCVARQIDRDPNKQPTGTSAQLSLGCICCLCLRLSDSHANLGTERSVARAIGSLEDARPQA